MIRITYGVRPGDKVIQKGNFICPLCCRKRQYLRIKVQKKAFVGLISLFSLGDIGEFVQCQSCLKPFPTKVLDAGLQLQMKIDSRPLPPADILDVWEQGYKALGCEAILTGRTDMIEVVSPILLTMASNMQEVGVKLRLEDYLDARKFLVNILNLGLEWHEISFKRNLDLQGRTPKQHERILEHMDAANELLSRLP